MGNKGCYVIGIHLQKSIDQCQPVLSMQADMNLNLLRLVILLLCVKGQFYRGYLVFFSVKDRDLFHRVDTIGNIFTRRAATSENITDGAHGMK